MSNLPTTTVTGFTSMLMDEQAFNHMQRVGKMLALSSLFPQHLKEGAGGMESAIANAVLVLNMASRLREDPLTVAQNIYFVNKRPGWATSYMIAKANQHTVFRDTIDWEIKGKGDTLAVTAFAVLASTGRRVEVTCDMAMAKAEGWTKNSKYQSMPEQMLRYRSAAFLIRLYCPEVMVGVPAAVEVELASTAEMRDITPAFEPEPDPSRDKVAEVEAKTAAPDGVAREIGETNRRAAAQKRYREEQRAAAPKPAAQPEQQNVQQQPVQEEQLPMAADTEPSASEEMDADTLERFTNWTDTIIADLRDGSHPDEVRDVWGPQLEMIEARAPQMFEKISKAMKEVLG